MSIERITRTDLWRKTLGEIRKDPNKAERDRLRNAYLGLRENCAHLVSRIAAIVPDLTQHEISHLDALWETASLITGADYEINPLEGFVLGSAFLIHDSALCPEAFEGGLNGLRDTTTWKDTFVLLSQNPSLTNEEIESQSDFIALRDLHAKRAEKLLEFSWTDPDGRVQYLLSDQTLTKHLGPLIGLVASSHHWDIDEVKAKLPSQVNAIPPFPNGWRIDPVKLAYILRCADAAHITNERAPDFLYALLKRSRVSSAHWKAQNRLSNADVDSSDPQRETLLFTSTLDFKEEDSDAWFLIFDALNLIEKELKSCNQLLQDNGKRTFQLKRVKGTKSPEELSRFVKPLNWKPTSVNVHISNVEDIIKRFGGVSLYGGDSTSQWVTVLRELIQNSRDAIKAREFVDQNFNGKIQVEIKRVDSSLKLIIKDNGIGMSERVLTGPFLDFGVSFWSSNLVKSEFPGLRSSGFKSIGKYGIGFYSVFMISNAVTICTRLWDDGSNQQKELKFKNGFSLRPLLSYSQERYNSSVTTQIELLIHGNIFDENNNIAISRGHHGAQVFHISFKNFVALVTAGLDVDVYVSEDDSSEVLAHQSICADNFDKKEWLKSIAIFDHRDNEISDEKIKDYSERLRFIDEDNKTFGLAALTFDAQDIPHTSISTIGGLCKTIIGDDHYWGFIDYFSESEKRNQSQKYSTSESKVKAWAENQFELAKMKNISMHEQLMLARRLFTYNVDAYEITYVYISKGGKNFFLDMKTLPEYCLNNKLYFPIHTIIKDYLDDSYDIQSLNEYSVVRYIQAGDYNSLLLIDGKPTSEISLLGTIFRSLTISKLQIKFTRIDSFHKSYLTNKIGAALELSVEKKK